MRALPRWVKYTRYPGPWWMRSSNTRSPTDLKSPALPCRKRPTRTVIRALACLSFRPAIQRLKVSVYFNVVIAPIVAYKAHLSISKWQWCVTFVGQSIHKTCAAFSEITRRLMMQSSIDAEALVRSDLALTIDKAGYYGTGSDKQPWGIAKTTGVNAVSFDAEMPNWWRRKPRFRRTTPTWRAWPMWSPLQNPVNPHERLIEGAGWDTGTPRI